MNFETILINDSNGKQQTWMIENDMGEETIGNNSTGAFTIFRLGTIKTIAKRDCYEDVKNGVLFCTKPTDIITREDKPFREVIEQCYFCEKDIYIQSKIKVDEEDHYVCTRCVNRRGLKVKETI